MSTKRKNYVINKDVEIPKSGRSFGEFCPFKAMEIGDSFQFAITDQPRVQVLAHSYGQKNGAAFFINISEQEGTVWRTA